MSKKRQHHELGNNFRKNLLKEWTVNTHNGANVKIMGRTKKGTYGQNFMEGEGIKREINVMWMGILEITYRINRNMKKSISSFIPIPFLVYKILFNYI